MSKLKILYEASKSLIGDKSFEDFSKEAAGEYKPEVDAILSAMDSYAELVGAQIIVNLNKEIEASKKNDGTISNAYVDGLESAWGIVNNVIRDMK